MDFLVDGGRRRHPQKETAVIQGGRVEEVKLSVSVQLAAPIARAGCLIPPIFSTTLAGAN
jgi:hypothetical protein